MKKLFAAVSLFLSTSCGGPTIADDGYYFESKEWDYDKVEITKIEYDNLGDLGRAAGKMGLNPKEGYAVQAFFVSYKGTDRCEIHVLNPEKGYVPTSIGHEISHCFYGNFHKEQDKSIYATK